LEGVRILLVEDEYFIAMELAATVAELGVEVVGPVGRLEPARELARTERLEGAVLDIDLGGQPSFPLAEELMERGVRLIFVTGFDATILPDRFRHVPSLTKPVNQAALRRLLVQEFRT
jgi:DNA-binding response OmpR family regulator